MKVMLADIEADALQAAVKSLREISPDIRGTICDVADPESVERAAQASFDAFGQRACRVQQCRRRGRRRHRPHLAG